jgi:hypothetical protein
MKLIVEDISSIAQKLTFKEKFSSSSFLDEYLSANG